jgi:predicted ATP-dependent endonuclease of OLD family
MTLEKLEIHGYRGFREPGSLSFATPNGKLGSGITVLTGANNSGKSSILECLRARYSGSENASFSEGTRNSAVDNVTICYTVNGKRELLRSIAKGSSETGSVGVDKGFEIFVLPSRRTFNPYFSKSEISRRDYVRSSGLPAQRTSVLTNFEHRLFSRVRNPNAFNALLNEVLGYETQWTIDRADHGQYFLKFYNGDYSHSSDGVGEGIISVFAIVDALHDSQANSLIVIDEPELSLHPAMQKRVALVLRRFSVDRQIVIATHSPYFVDLDSITNGGQVARIVGGRDGTRIFQLSASSIESIERLSRGNLYNPHVFGLDSRELFFQEDSVILTEGQEDVLLLPRAAQQLDMHFPGHFFGWGAGGAGNIMPLCQVLKDLGFTKVAALLDGDKVRDRDKLREKFPEFYFECLPAKDVRTKPMKPSTPAVLGLLDESLVLREEYRRSLEVLLRKLTAHLRT